MAKTKIKRRLKCFIFLLTVAGSLAARQASVEHTLLFRVTAPGSDHVSYLFGTHHAFGKSFFDSLAHASAALDASEVVLTETGYESGQASHHIINSRTTTTSWPKFLSKNDLTYLRALFSDNSMDFEKILPAELFAALYRHYTITACGTRSSNDPNLSMDEYIAFEAEKAGKTVVGLETIDEQLAIISKDVEGMPARVHKRRLSRLVELIRSENQAADCSDATRYRTMAFDYQLAAPCQNALVLTDRNARWLQTIVASLQSGNCFVAVGLSHLRFECGLLSLLRKEGFVVTPVATR